jgi:CHAD domain-containing protein
MTRNTEQGLLEAFDVQWDDYRKQFRTARKAISEESIHDLRVSARRMQALLNMVKALDDRSRVKKMRRFLDKQLNQLDDLRDTQVMIQEADRAIGSQPHLIPLRDDLQKRLHDLSSAGHKRLRKLKPSDLQQRATKIRKLVKRHSHDPDLADRVLQSADAAYARTRARLGRLDAGDPNTVHRVRVAFKKFRYTAEMLRAFLPRPPQEYPDKMHDYQDAMGKVHDTQVFLDNLRSFELDTAGKPGRNGELDLKPAEQSYRSRLADLIVAYFQRKDELDSFWRLTPDEPFPWEKSHESVHRTTRNRRGSGSKQHGGAGQSAAAHRRRTKEVSTDRAGTGQPGDENRPDTNQSVPAGS